MVSNYLGTFIHSDMYMLEGGKLMGTVLSSFIPQKYRVLRVIFVTHILLPLGNIIRLIHLVSCYQDRYCLEQYISFQWNLGSQLTPK